LGEDRYRRITKKRGTIRESKKLLHVAPGGLKRGQAGSGGGEVANGAQAVLRVRGKGLRVSVLDR